MGVIVSKKSNGSPVPSVDRAVPRHTMVVQGTRASGRNALRWGETVRVKRIANCELALCLVYSNRYYLRSSTLCPDPAPGDALCRDTRSKSDSRRSVY